MATRADDRQTGRAAATFSRDPQRAAVPPRARERRSDALTQWSVVRGPETVSSLGITSVQALRGRIGNRSLARLLSGGHQNVLARTITIEGIPHDADGYYGFSSKLRRELHQWGYTTPSRLLRIVQVALGRVGLTLKGDEQDAARLLTERRYPSWIEFVEDLAQRGYTSGLIPSALSLRRPYKLGKRPAWISKIAALAPPKEKQARRHVIPSHFLGYVVENWQTSPELIRLWLGDARGINHALVSDVVGATNLQQLGEFQLKRLVWRILGNHAGNIWWGDGVDNSAIGFLAPHIEKLLDGLRDAEVNSELSTAPAKQLIESVPEMKGTTPLAHRWNELRQQMRSVINFDDVADIVEGIEDVFDGMELDPANIRDSYEVVALRGRLERVDTNGAEFLAFLKKDWAGTIKLT
jgi:hypothetical protein